MTTTPTNIILSQEQLDMIQTLAQELMNRAMNHMEENGLAIYKIAEVEELESTNDSLLTALKALDTDLEKMFEESQYVCGGTYTTNGETHSFYKVSHGWPEQFWYLDTLLEITPNEPLEQMEITVDLVEIPNDEQQQ